MISVIQGKFYIQRFSNTSLGRTLLGSNFGGLLREQTFCRHFEAFLNARAEATTTLVQVKVVIFFPLQNPLSPTPPNGPETDPKQTRNGAKRTRNGPKRTEIKPFGAGRAGGFVGMGGGVGVVREKNITKFCQESPRQTKPKKGPKRKVHEFRPFL